MLRKLGTLSFVLGAAALGLLPVQARADVTAPQTVSIGATDTNFGPGTALNDPMVFNQFNPSLGTLTSVSVSVSYDFIHTSTITFYTPGTIGTSATENTISVTLPNGQTIASGTAPDYSSSTKFDPSTMSLNKSITLAPKTDMGSLGPVSLTSSTDLALFTGSGTISIPVLASSLAGQSTNNANCGARVTTEAGAKVTISYTYTPHPAVPEPSSVVLLGLGGCGLFLYRRRRQAA
ncbi:MAG: choice-of-anchor E domain-containing protein [Isosphaeraceae bacterium]|nr:choice-of-anchor E domain-containing protein [Isosphaeraceae bacterium]